VLLFAPPTTAEKPPTAFAITPATIYPIPTPIAVLHLLYVLI
ncbi:hypothetical protein HMPREF1866_01083, partial [Lachnoanaerobaculum saburreum]